MKTDKRFTEVKFERGKPLKPLEEQSLAACRIRLAPAVMDLYRQANGFSFRWKLKTASSFACGEVCLPGFLQTFLHPWKGKLWFDEMSETRDETELRSRRASPGSTSPMRPSTGLAWPCSRTT